MSVKYYVMRNILAVVREPEKADNFILYSASIARDMRSHLHIVYVEEEYEYTIGRPPAPGNYAGDEQSRRLERARIVLGERIAVVLRELSDEISLDYSADLASLISVIDHHISTENPDFVMLEADEPHGLLFSGTSNDEIAEEIRSPVLIVPDDVIYRPPVRIVYATAINSNDIRALNDVVRLTSHLKPSIRVLHISDEIKVEVQASNLSYIENLQKETGYTDISSEYIVKDNTLDVSTQIMQYALRYNAGLLVVLQEEKTFFAKLFGENRTKDIAKDPDVPVLIYKFDR